MAYVPLETADMAAGKPARGGSFALRIDQNFEDHEARIVVAEADIDGLETDTQSIIADVAALDTRVDALEALTAETELTITTTGNIDNLALGGASLLRVNNATLATIRGIAAPTAGQPKRVTIVSIGAGHVNLAHQNAGSTDVNRLINFATSGDTPLAAGVGTAVYVYDETTDRWRLETHKQGAWITPTFAAGNFTGNGGMTWTVESGEVANFSFLLDGRTLFFAFTLTTTSVGGSVNTLLQMAIPGGFVVAKSTQGGGAGVTDNGVNVSSYWSVLAAGTVVRIAKIDGSNWTLSTNNSNVAGSAAFEVQ